MHLKAYLKQPFPMAQNKWRLILLISIFVALFLILFQPFGIQMMENSLEKLLILGGYGLVTFFVLVIDLIFIERLFPKTFSEKNWTIGKEFLWLMWILFSIGLGNAFYTGWVIPYFTVNLRFILSFQGITLLVGLIPISLMIISKQNYLLRKHKLSARAMNIGLQKKEPLSHKPTPIRFVAENEKDTIEFSSEDLWFIESSGNYVEIYLNKGQEIVRKTYRSTLKRALSFFDKNEEIIQCHRAFIVNSSKITDVKGNSQGLRLKLKDGLPEIPVSRGFVSQVKSKIASREL